MTHATHNCTGCPVTAGTHKPADAVHTEIAEPGANGGHPVDDLCAAILRLPCKKPTLMAERSPENAYVLGHRDARHAAAELAATQEAELSALQARDEAQQIELGKQDNAILGFKARIAELEAKAQGAAVASIYVTASGAREFDDWRHPLPVGSNLLYTAPSPAVPAPAIPLELRGVAEVVGNGDGFWCSCAGCHELNEGHATGAVSQALGCALGGGCSECGGIGAIWDTTDYNAMAEFMAEGTTPAEAVPAPQAALAAVPEGWREQFAVAVYDDLAAADNQDVPLEEYPARILKVMESIVGPRHPTVVKWRNDAIRNCIAIAYKYCRDPESHNYLKQDLEAMLAAAPAHPVEGVPGEVTDAMVHAALRIQHPNLYREYLRHPGNGVKAAATAEKEIETARLMIAAALAATPAAPAAALEVNDAMALAFHHAITDGSIGADDLEEIKTGLRAALANVCTAQAAVVPAAAPAAAPAAVEIAIGPCGQCKDDRQPCACQMDTMLKERGLVAVDAAHYAKVSARAKAATPAAGVPSAAPDARDAERMDWIERQGRVCIDRVREGHIEGPLRWDVEYGHYGDEAKSKISMRAAIDAAIAAQAKGEQA